MAVKVEVIQGTDAEDVGTKVETFITTESIALASLSTVTINDVKGRPTGVVVYDDGN